MTKALFFALLISVLSAPISFGQTDTWQIRGKVTNEFGRAMGGLTVNAYDRDRKGNDHLGRTMTDNRGQFRIRYRTTDFKESQTEKSPDLYLKITDTKGKVIYNSKKRARAKAGRNEYFNVKIQAGIKPKLKSRKIQIERKGVKTYELK